VAIRIRYFINSTGFGVSNRLYKSVFNGFGADATADKIGVGILALTGVAIAAHAVISAFKGDK